MSVFVMPSLGADMEDGKLVEWLIKPGDAVHRGDVVAVVETQKGAIEIEIFEDGIVQSLEAELGATLPVGATLANGGTNPITGQQIVKPEVVQQTLRLMNVQPDMSVKPQIVVNAVEESF